MIMFIQYENLSQFHRTVFVGRNKALVGDEADRDLNINTYIYMDKVSVP